VAASPGAILPLAVPRAFSPRALSRGSALRQDAFDAQPQRRRVAEERQLDRLAGQRLGLAAEQCRGGDRRLVAAGDRRPKGLPDRSFSNGRPRTRPGAFGASSSVIGISLVQRAGHSRGRPRPGVCMSIRQFLDRHHRNKTIPLGGDTRTCRLAVGFSCRK